ncbi:hypothetical protein POL68_42050 [Stigmatella sp. ncwal1]|uniref:Uncharacterized protein n=1 Tax=Stigmatella ashevillensis TaxID=2995309 RepID=A0ABT5DN86_9BACT|nr:hypothetical protein [Stigmatella ashevillena]MDC0715106.1 hypothetical protein [Stigmatella ashevillena]
MSAAWEDAWRNRLDTWQRKRLYDGLHRVFLAFCTVETWAETIEGMGLVRHLLVHGESKVTAELAAFCAKPHSMKLGFKEGEPLSMHLFHLQAFEAFTDQLLNALNISLAEHPVAAK